MLVSAGALDSCFVSGQALLNTVPAFPILWVSLCAFQYQKVELFRVVAFCDWCCQLHLETFVVVIFIPVVKRWRLKVTRFATLGDRLWQCEQPIGQADELRRSTDVVQFKKTNVECYNAGRSC